MKKILIIGFTLLIGLMISGCNKAEANDSPTSVAKQFCETILKGDAKACSELWVESTEGFVRCSVAPKEYANPERIAKFEETINGDNAIVTITYNDNSTFDIDLKKVNGKWKIYIK